MRLVIVTPSGSQLDQEIDEVAAPGIGGEFGVLAGHTPFLTALRPGVVSWKQGGNTGRLAVSTGYAEVSGDDRVVVLTASAVAADKVDAAEVRRELEEAERALAAWNPPEPGVEDDNAASFTPRSVLEARRDYALARLELKSN